MVFVIAYWRYFLSVVCFVVKFSFIKFLLIESCFSGFIKLVD